MAVAKKIRRGRRPKKEEIPTFGYTVHQIKYLQCARILAFIEEYGTNTKSYSQLHDMLQADLDLQNMLRRLEGLTKCKLPSMKCFNPNGVFENKIRRNKENLSKKLKKIPYFDCRNLKEVAEYYASKKSPEAFKEMQQKEASKQLTEGLNVDIIQELGQRLESIMLTMRNYSMAVEVESNNDIDILVETTLGGVKKMLNKGLEQMQNSDKYDGALLKDFLQIVDTLGRLKTLQIQHNNKNKAVMTKCMDMLHLIKEMGVVIKELFGADATIVMLLADTKKAIKTADELIKVDNNADNLN